MEKFIWLEGYPKFQEIEETKLSATTKTATTKKYYRSVVPYLIVAGEESYLFAKLLEGGEPQGNIRQSIGVNLGEMVIEFDDFGWRGG